MQENNPEVPIVEQARLIKHQSYTRAGIILSSLILVAFVYGLLCPPVVTNSYADSNTDAVVTEAGVNVGSMISIALDPSIDIDVMPSSSTVYDKKAAKLTVTTNNSSGYSLYMQTLGDTANLTSDDLSNTTTIAPLAKASILEQFETNTWGYNLGRSGSIDKDRIYYPVPTTSTTVMETGGTSYRDEYDLTFGVAVSNNLPVGRYSNSVMISAVANPTVITSLNQAQYMQTMNKELCQNTDYGVTKQLIDMRDGKKYWVARLLDGNCWMTQNLALTLKDFGDGNGIHAMTENGDMGSKLTSDNTDLPLKVVNGATQSTAWDESSEYPPTEALARPEQYSGDITSWSFGSYVWATPNSPVNCSTTIGLDPYNKCASNGFVNVSDANKWQAATTADNEWLGTLNNKEQYLAVRLNTDNDPSDGGIYDAHRLVGNFYTHGAATAGTDINAGSGVATSSICPKGWGLPTSGTAYNDALDSYYNLFKQYNAEISNQTSALTLISKPVYITLSGSRDSGGTGGALYLSGTTNQLWSSISQNYASITSSSVSPSSSLSNSYGFSIRCLTH